MTPAEFDPLVCAWRNKQRRIQSRFAMVAHVAAAVGGVKISGRTPELSDFMDGWDTEIAE